MAAFQRGNWSKYTTMAGGGSLFNSSVNLSGMSTGQFVRRRQLWFKVRGDIAQRIKERIVGRAFFNIIEYMRLPVVAGGHMMSRFEGGRIGGALLRFIFRKIRITRGISPVR